MVDLIKDFKNVCNDENQLAYARSKYDVKIRPPKITVIEKEEEVQVSVHQSSNSQKVAKNKIQIDENESSLHNLSKYDVTIETKLKKSSHQNLNNSKGEDRFDSLHIPNERGPSTHIYYNQ